MTDLESMTAESATVLGIAAQISALPDYHDIARSMLARLANRSSSILGGKPDWKKAGRPPRYTRESLIAALTAAGGNARVASRFGLPKRLTGDGAGGVVEIAIPTGGGRRACISCSKPFWSEGKHNRLRAKCNSDDGLSAAEVA